MMERDECAAAIGPPQLLGHAGGAADVQHDGLRGCQIERASVLVYRKSIRDELHDALLCDVSATRCKKTALAIGAADARRSTDAASEEW
jgi:hypothetical protein